MIGFICDQTGCDKGFQNDKPAVELNGYYPSNAAGILIPENCRRFQFCSAECFLVWMRWAMIKETRCAQTEYDGK